MVREAERFKEEDEAQRKRVEKLNEFSAYVFGLKSQIDDREGLGGRLEVDDKKTILDEVKGATEWIDINGSSASGEELEEKLSGIMPVRPVIARPADGDVQIFKRSLPRSSLDYTRREPNLNRRRSGTSTRNCDRSGCHWL
jgi:hypothetical protein